MMAMCYAMSNHSGCCMNYAVAGTSAGKIMNRDTAVAAVSIFIVRLVVLLVLKV